ncbi:MAG TPA: hypothetical protein VL547_18530 [Dinghuibacter sp.]|jgi:hypothetical protein|uniref:hypothetical protein n=1 Tax=Dinghuibacter sp. TaxID=2024697 RepID=UPI002C5AC57D|nr:hypothetical protein [Dinghuibacter sp.]HTJ14044.1 hypothetical protein [Dinghuibacter sp.]
MRHILTLMAFCLLAQSPRAQEFGRNLLKTKTGALIVYNSTNRGFSIQVRADSIRSIADNDFMELDGTLFQTALIPIPLDQPIDTLTMAQQRAVLKGYLTSELKYFRDDAHIAYINVKTAYVALGGHLFLRWSFDVLPATAATAKPAHGQIYYSTVAFNQVLDLNIPLLRKVDTFERCNAILARTARTLNLSRGQPIDLDLKYQELNQ